MGVTLTQLLAEANNHIQFDDTVKYTVAERKLACGSAIKTYSARRPNPILQSYTGIGANPFYDLPTSWNEGFSSIYEIEYKVDQTPKQIIQSKHYVIDLMSDGLKIRFDEVYPGDAETFYVKYFGNHTFDSAGDSDIVDADLKGLSYLAASIMCQELSTYFASKADPNLANVEIVEFQSRVDEYGKKASSWLKLYNKTIISDTNSTWGSIDFVDDLYWNRNNQ